MGLNYDEQGEFAVETVSKKIFTEDEDYVTCIRELVENALDWLSKNAKISYNIELVDLENLDDKSLKETGEFFFIQFSTDGDVVVVGAGYDYGMPENEIYTNVKILNKLGKKWSNQAIFIIVEGLREVCGHSGSGPKDKMNLKSYLECRNGVEMLIGEWLLSNGIPILNTNSHKNYLDSFWKKVIEHNHIDYHYTREQ